MKIVSGGQTGIDRGALDAAIACNVDCGGWCPHGRLAEDGRLPMRYPLRELADAGYPQRTRQNVVDSDGTLIVFSHAFDGGTALTATLCEAERRPVCLLDAALLTAADARQHTAQFIRDNEIKVLNVAGPRASKWPEGHAYAYELISAVLTALATAAKDRP